MIYILKGCPQPSLKIKRVCPGGVVTGCVDLWEDEKCAITDVTSRDFPVTIDHQQKQMERWRWYEVVLVLSPLLFLDKVEEEEEEEERSHPIPSFFQTPDISELERHRTPLIQCPHPPHRSTPPSHPPSSPSSRPVHGNMEGKRERGEYINGHVEYNYVP